MTNTKHLKSFHGYSMVLSKMLGIYNKTKWDQDSVRLAVNRNLGNIYRGAMNKMHSLDSEDRDKAREMIDEIKAIGDKYYYFNIKAGYLLTYHIALYRLIVSLRDKFLVKSMNRQKDA